jgi:hypothetical protein
MQMQRVNRVFAEWRADEAALADPQRALIHLLPRRLNQLASDAAQQGLKRGRAQLAFNKLLNTGSITLRGTPDGVFVVGRRDQ